MIETYVIYVSGDCNCQCKYCYLQNGLPIKERTWEEVKSYLDNIILYNKKFAIEFLGGEPMLNFNLIEQTVNYLESLRITDNINVVQYTITTNGTIVHEELVNLLKSNRRLSFAASMDGTKVMNQLRLTKDNKNTYDIVVKNINYLFSQDISNNQISVHLVTHPYNIHLLSQGIDHLYGLGIRRFGIGTIESTIKIGREYCNLYLSELKLLSDNIHAGIYPGISIDVLMGLKPKGDVRKYVKDENGYMVGETYGRAGDDITTQNKYVVDAGQSALGDLIYDIRKAVYDYHNSHKELIRR
jgi:sulfatase maturation enzyme AslB (radical SAM superfamily)